MAETSRAEPEKGRKPLATDLYETFTLFLVLIELVLNL